MMANPYADAARSRKAALMVVVLRDAGADPETVDAFTDEEWATAERAARLRRPCSSETRAMVVDLLRRAAATLALPADPFALFPGAGR